MISVGVITTWHRRRCEPAMAGPTSCRFDRARPLHVRDQEEGSTMPKRPRTSLLTLSKKVMRNAGT